MRFSVSESTAHPPELAPAAEAPLGPAARQVLLVNEDPAVLETLAAHILQRNGFVLTFASSVTEALARLGERSFSLVIVGFALAVDGGAHGCRALVAARRCPVLVWGGEPPLDEIAALELGAADYVPSTAHPLAFLVRCRTLLQRAGPSAPVREPPELATRDWSFHPPSGLIRSGAGGAWSLKAGAARLLEALCRNAPQIIDREALRGQMGFDGASGPSRALDTAVSRLRVALAACDGLGGLIQTAQGRGYRLAGVVSSYGDLLIVERE